jgi:hypothetical protein
MVRRQKPPYTLDDVGNRVREETDSDGDTVPDHQDPNLQIPSSL